MNAKDIALIKALGGGGGGGGLPSGGTPYQQLVTDADGNTQWEDRLAYVATEEHVIFSQENIEFYDCNDGYYGYDCMSPFGNIVIGEKYTVILDGVTYPDLVAFKSFGYPSIGVDDDSITEERPFKISTLDCGDEECGLTVLMLTSEATHTISILKKVEDVRKIPQVCMPELTKLVMLSSTSGSTKKFEITVDDTGTLSATEITSGDTPQ